MKVEVNRPYSCFLPGRTNSIVLTTTYSVLGFCGGIGDQELLILTFVHFLSLTKLQDIE
jgi:hypothetical protein